MAYIVAAVRTAGGKRGGRLSGWHATDLGATVLNSLVEKTKIDPALIDDVIMGCVDQAGAVFIDISMIIEVSHQVNNHLMSLEIVF
jgi:acetyl-CoA C-acetyltransferase